MEDEPISEDSVDEDRKIEEDIQESEKISQTEEKISQTSTENVKVTKENVNSEINKMKQQLSQDINDMQNVVPENQNFQQYIPTTMQVDPVDQIRRYYELKEDGIITEEEFEQKKKQLLNL